MTQTSCLQTASLELQGLHSPAVLVFVFNLMDSLNVLVQGNLNNFASSLSCEQACVEGTLPATGASAISQVTNAAQSDLIFLASALTTKSWLTLDATSVSEHTPSLHTLSGCNLSSAIGDYLSKTPYNLLSAIMLDLWNLDL